MSTWILLRGLTREQGHWGDFAQLLRVGLPDGDVVLTPDLPGNGSLNHQTSPVHVPEMVEACRQLLRAQGHAPPYSVLAMSLGAMATVDWADRHPHELTRAVLINTSLRPYSPFWHRLRPQQYPRILKLLALRPNDLQWEQAIMAMTTRHPASPQATLAHWVALRQAHPVSARNGLRQLLAATRYGAPAQAPKVPMLLLNSLGDQLVNPACSAALAKPWQLPLFRHPTAGHDLPLDAGPWVVQQVQAWLQAQPARPTPEAL
jgi:pimeloyl-ACP methyl ester carboxylesterase